VKAVTLEWHLDVFRMSTYRIRKGGFENKTKKRDGNNNKLVNIRDMVEGKNMQGK